jgi:hypothetical protein
MQTRFIKLILFSLLLTTPFIHARAENSRITRSVSILNKVVHHQGINRLDIKVKYTFQKSGNKLIRINDALVKHQIDSLLAHYPDTTDWWEIVNKNITAFFMSTYPEIDSMGEDILVHWVSGAGVDYGHRFPTRSITSRTRKGSLHEYFGFTTPIDSLFFCSCLQKPHKIFIDLKYHYVQRIDDKDYPDGLAAENDFKKFLADNSMNLKFWDEIIEKTQKDMLAKYRRMQDLTSDIIVYDAGGEQYEATTYTGR